MMTTKTLQGECSIKAFGIEPLDATSAANTKVYNSPQLVPTKVTSFVAWLQGQFYQVSGLWMSIKRETIKFLHGPGPQLLLYFFWQSLWSLFFGSLQSIFPPP